MQQHKDRRPPAPAGRTRLREEDLGPTLERIKSSSARWPKRQKITGVPKNLWSTAEDATLLRLVQEKGESCWTEVALELPGRVGKQCRDRWRNHLNPNIKKGPWTEEEDRLLFHFEKVYEHSWSDIARQIPGRTDLSVKNRWYSYQRKAIRHEKRLARGSSSSSSSSSASTATEPAEPAAAPSRAARNEAASAESQPPAPAASPGGTSAPPTPTGSEPEAPARSKKDEESAVSAVVAAAAAAFDPSFALRTISQQRKELEAMSAEKNRLEQALHFALTAGLNSAAMQPSPQAAASDSSRIEELEAKLNMLLEMHNRSATVAQNVPTGASTSWSSILSKLLETPPTFNTGSSSSLLQQMQSTATSSPHATAKRPSDLDQSKAAATAAPSKVVTTKAVEPHAAQLLLGLARTDSMPQRVAAPSFSLQGSLGLSPTGQFFRSASSVYGGLRLEPRAASWPASAK